MYILEATFPIKENVGKYFQQFIDSTINAFKRNAGYKPELYYFTFKGDGYKEGRVTMVCTSTKNFGDKKLQRHRIIVTALDEDIYAAIEEVKNMNYHLLLEKDIVGYNADDFIHGRLSATLNVN